MIKFFRRIRQRLIGEGNLKRYLLYSLGEIILVTIGILLAFQVNSWNEKRKERVLELNTYSELINDLNTTVKSMHIEEEELNSQLYLVYNSVKNKAPLTDSLKNAFSTYMLFHPVYFRDNTYQSLRQKGMEILSNESIKTKLVDLYETDFKWYSDGHMPISITLVNKAMNFYSKHFESNLENPSNISKATPNDYEALLDNQEFLNNLSIMIAIRKGLLNWKRNTEKKINSLVEEIEKEKRYINRE